MYNILERNTKCSALWTCWLVWVKKTHSNHSKEKPKCFHNAAVSAIVFSVTPLSHDSPVAWMNLNSNKKKTRYSRWHDMSRAKRQCHIKDKSEKSIKYSQLIFKNKAWTYEAIIDVNQDTVYYIWNIPSSVNISNKYRGSYSKHGNISSFSSHNFQVDFCHQFFIWDRSIHLKPIRSLPHGDMKDRDTFTPQLLKSFTYECSYKRMMWG